MPGKNKSLKNSAKNVLKARNGKIEFLRFLFCIIVLLYHIAESTIGLKYEILDNITFFGKGYFCVEFFFIVSGYLMASFDRYPILEYLPQTPYTILHHHDNLKF